MVSISFCFKRCLWSLFVRIRDRIQTPWGNAWWTPLHPIFSKELTRFWHYKQVAWWIATSVFITTFFLQLILKIPLFRYSASFPHWLILPNFPWLLLPSFNSLQGLSARQSILFLEPMSNFVRVFRLSGRCMKLSWSSIAWATELLRTHRSRKREISI